MQQPSISNTVKEMSGELHLAIMQNGKVLLEMSERGWVLPSKLCERESRMREEAVVLAEKMTGVKGASEEVFHVFSSHDRWTRGSIAAVFMWDLPTGASTPEDEAGITMWMPLEDMVEGCEGEIEGTLSKSLLAAGIKSVARFRDVLKSSTMLPKDPGS